jgi:hypothetical protein
VASRKGKPNKSSWEIKELIDSTCDMQKVVNGLVRLATGPHPNTKAAEILLAYRFGKPRESVDVTSGGKVLGFDLGALVRDAFGIPEKLSVPVPTGVAERPVAGEDVCEGEANRI